MRLADCHSNLGANALMNLEYAGNFQSTSKDSENFSYAQEENINFRITTWHLNFMNGSSRHDSGGRSGDGHSPILWLKHNPEYPLSMNFGNRLYYM